MNRREQQSVRSARTPGAATRQFRKVVDFIWPPTSLITGREIAGPGVLEPSDWSKLRFLTGAMCARCGIPFEIEIEPGQVCAACIARPPAYDRARSALEYAEVSRDIVLALKHGGRRDGLATLAAWMASAGAELLEDADLLVPTPLHYFRLVRRGFNQSVWLAAALERRTGTLMALDILRRKRSTPIQGGLSANARRRNVEGAFAVPLRKFRRLQGKRILLIDDVLTTGATAEACARTLKRCGAAEVDVLTLTRVAGPRSLPI